MSARAGGTMIEVDRLSVTFGRGRVALEAVREVSFRVEAGAAFGLVGESGAGKTSVLRALAGLVTDWRGHMAIAGTALGRRRDRGFYKLVQMVFQDPYGSLHPRHTVDRILAEPVAIHELDDAEGRIRRALDTVGLGPAFRFRYPHQLSGGERQRVAIARALLKDAPILILDEPTSALDAETEGQLLGALDNLMAGRTTLIIAHRLSTIRGADRIVVLDHGRVVEDGSHDALLRREGVYARLHGLQFGEREPMAAGAL